MIIESWVTLLDGITALLEVIIWPVVLVWLILRYGTRIHEFASELTELSIKGGGVEATVKRKIAVAVALGAAGAKVDAQSGTGIQNESRPEAIEAFVSERITARSFRKLDGARILWVDDRPDNNIYERGSLEALGIRFDIALDTEEALRMIAAREYDAIISDMGRPPDLRAGYTLLKQIRSMGSSTPFVIYAGSNLAKHKKEALEKGAVGSTNRPIELMEIVLTAMLV